MKAFYWAINVAISKLTPPLENYVTITDLDGYGLRNNDWSLMKVQSDEIQNNYPERLGVSYIINAPWYIASVWKIISRWLDDKTRRKINFLGKDFKSTLVELIDEESLPVQIGGKYPLPPPELDMWDTKANNNNSESDKDKDIEKELEKQVEKDKK